MYIKITDNYNNAIRICDDNEKSYASQSDSEQENWTNPFKPLDENLNLLFQSNIYITTF